MTQTIKAKRVFKDMCQSFNGYNYTEYSDMSVFDVNIDNFQISFGLNNATGEIRVSPTVQDYRNDRDYGVEKDMV